MRAVLNTQKDFLNNIVTMVRIVMRESGSRSKKVGTALISFPHHTVTVCLHCPPPPHHHHPHTHTHTHTPCPGHDCDAKVRQLQQEGGQALLGVNGSDFPWGFWWWWWLLLRVKSTTHNTHAHTHACTHTHAHAHTHTCTHTHTHTHTNTHTHTHTCSSSNILSVMCRLPTGLFCL